MRSSGGSVVLALALLCGSAAAEPELLEREGAGAFTLVLANDRVFYSSENLDDGAGLPIVIASVPKAGGARAREVALENGVSGLVVAGKHTFFSELGTPTSGPRCRGCEAPRSYLDGSINRVGPGGKVVKLARKQHMPLGLVSDGKQLYWANPGDDAEDTGAIMRVAHKGGRAKKLAQLRRVRGVAVDAKHLYVIVDGPGDNPTASLFRLKKTGGKVEKLGEVTGAARALQLDADRVYVTAGRRVVALPKTGGEATVLADDQDEPTALALDDTRVYFTSYTGGAVLAVAKTGGALVTIAAGEPHAAAIAVDATHVYWSSDLGLRRLPKP